MDISIGPYKFRLEILILIGLLLWVIFGHVVCSCSRVGLMEGYKVMTDAADAADASIKKQVAQKEMTGENSDGESATTVTVNAKAGTENFANLGNFSPDYQSANYQGANTASWSMPTLDYTKGGKLDAGAQAILDRPKQPIPLPEGELDMFATTEFKPECCPNTYTNGSGCACMTMEQAQNLWNRGGNNVPYSEY
jgi:hypothetical protein